MPKPPCTAHRAGALCSCSSVFFAHFMGGGDNPVMVLALHPKPGGLFFFKYLPPKPRVGLGSERGAPPAPASGGFALLQAPRGAPARSPWGLRTPCPSPPPSPKPSTRTSKGPTPASRCRPGGLGACLGGSQLRKGGLSPPRAAFRAPPFPPLGLCARRCRCIVKITGEMVLSFPAGITRHFANNPAPAVLTFRVLNYNRLEHVLPNPQLLCW